jgi:hypothetical protein
MINPMSAAPGAAHNRLLGELIVISLVLIQIWGDFNYA